jgi:hypothetical protein
MQTAEAFLPQPSASEVEVAIGKLKSYKSSSVGQIQAELIQAGGETLRSEIHKLIKLIWNKGELPHKLKESVVVPIDKKGNKSVCSNYLGILLLSASHNILSSILLAWLNPYADEMIGEHQCGFRRNRQGLMKFSISGGYWKKLGYNGTVHQLFMDFKKAYYSV